MHLPIAVSNTNEGPGTVKSSWISAVGGLLTTMEGDLVTLANPAGLAIISKVLHVATPVVTQAGREVLGFIRRRLDG